MLTLDTVPAVMLGAVLLVLVLGSAAMLFRGLRAHGEARAIRAEAARTDALLRAAPALAMTVRADGRLDIPDRLVDWLGLHGVPRFLPELAGNNAGLSPDDVAALTTAVSAAQRAARPFSRALRPVGSDRTLGVSGNRAPDALGATGAVVLWFFDATEAQGEIGRLVGETARLNDAFDALTGLIE
ncbi:MAG TPA: histidine kinase, partial [Sphingomonas sp.]